MGERTLYLGEMAQILRRALPDRAQGAALRHAGLVRAALCQFRRRCPR
jgi:hypothetical protein